MIAKLNFGSILVKNRKKLIPIFQLESKAWEHDSLYGHSNNVSCVVFQDKLVKKKNTIEI